MSGCFCHLNGYEVKDAAARESIVTLEGLIAEQTNEIGKNSTAIETAKADIETANANISKNAADIETANANISKNAADIETANANISKNAADIGSLDSLGTNDKSTLVNAVNELAEGDVYSTEEKRIGTWIDGKPLYRKVIPVVVDWNDSVVGNRYIDHGITNFKNVVSVKASMNRYPLPYMKNGTPTTFVYSVGNEQILIANGENWSGYTLTCIIEYTKTTD